MVRRLCWLVRDLINRVTKLNDAGVVFRSLTEHRHDHLEGPVHADDLGRLAEMGRELMRERTLAGPVKDRRSEASPLWALCSAVFGLCRTAPP